MHSRTTKFTNDEIGYQSRKIPRKREHFTSTHSEDYTFDWENFV